MSIKTRTPNFNASPIKERSGLRDQPSKKTPPSKWNSPSLTPPKDYSASLTSSKGKPSSLLESKGSLQTLPSDNTKTMPKTPSGLGVSFLRVILVVLLFGLLARLVVSGLYLKSSDTSLLLAPSTSSASACPSKQPPPPTSGRC